ncbi:MAG: hypothetical protein IJS78_07255, partial [Clostridia bacterium]|nr:hypothetical protein [Clostridia bacterium]
MKKLFVILLTVTMLLPTFSFNVSAHLAEGEDPTPANIGIAATKSGVEFSNVKLFQENGDPLIAGPGVGAHGGHETRIVRTENGTYAAYITSATGNQKDDKGNDSEWWTAVKNDPVLYEKYKYYYNGIAKFRIIKITADGFETLYEGEYPQAAGSCTPNILSDGNGKVYVTIIADDKDRYGSTMGTSEFTNGIWLEVIEVDTATDTVTAPEAPSRFDHTTTPFADHGYGYSQPLLDVEHGKLYAITNGGEAEDPEHPEQGGFIAWWIYDLNTRTWDPTCHTIERFSRRCYMNVYPDGNGGFTFVTQRCAPKKELGVALGGCTFTASNYMWDALYVMHVPDPTVDYAEDTTIWEPTYQPGKKTNITASASHYGTGGCTYLDDQGRIHVIYSLTYYTTPTSKTTKISGAYHAMYDLSGNELYNELIPTALLDKNGTKMYEGPQGFAMTQGSDGVYYIFVLNSTATSSTLSVWSSPADDGVNFTKKVNSVTLKDDSGSNVADVTKPIIGNTRNGSVLDGTVAMMFHTGASGGGDYYYYMSITVDKPVPHDHVWVDTVTDPTCTERGYTTHVCSVCNKKVKDSYTDPLGHEWGEWTVTVEPTEQATGVRERVCSRCGATDSEELPPVAHVHDYVAV